MSGPLVSLDFVAPRGRTTATAVVLLFVGLIAFAADPNAGNGDAGIGAQNPAHVRKRKGNGARG